MIVGVLVIVSVVIIACILLNRVSSRLGMPMLLAFILLGMLFGQDGILKIEYNNFPFTEQICTFALIFIMFYGGFGTNWKEAKPVVFKAINLSSVGVILTAAFVGLFCHLVLKIQILESFLIGSVISSTDAASVFSILRSKKMNLRYNTASLLEVESGSNDPWAYMLTIIFLTLISGKDASSVTYLVFAQIFFGVIFGFAIALLALFVLKRFNFLNAGFDTAFVLAIALLSYALPSLVSGNGYLSAYIVGIVLGNSKFANKRGLVHFFDGFTGIMQMLIFFLLGLQVVPSELGASMLISLLIALFLTFIGRPLVVFALMAPFKSKLKQQVFVSWAGLRGASSIVFAIMVAVAEVQTTHNIFNIVFCIVLFSIALQGSLMPFLAKKLKMIDKNSNVLRTFNDYTEQVEVDFISIPITDDSKWKGEMVKDVSLPPDSIIALIVRGDKTIIPKGFTEFKEGDVVIIGASSFEDSQNIKLAEIKIDTDHEWNGKKIMDISLTDNSLIILIKRKTRVLIPNGNTVLKLNDILVLNSTED